MDKSNVILFIIMAWTLLVYGGVTYLIVKKKAYGLMSGFSNRSDDYSDSPT
ncbi:hypothetical protein [Paraliobacillus sp. JSM ZJ581]|uniref:hypothetical protein n=1 Tax=Paraliobacillus sp. JSM ZJ581 TaxID=3342118 RepID=UPI0035A9345F